MNFFQSSNVKKNSNGFNTIVFLGIAVLLIFIIQLFVGKWCYQAKPNSYERFEDKTGDPYGERLQQLETILVTLKSDLEILDDSADDTCDITNQIETNYINNNSAPSSSTEYELPLDEQKMRQKRREIRAKKRFETEKSRFSIINKMPTLYECFTSQSNKDLLEKKISEVERLIDTVEIKAAAAKVKALQSLLMFNAEYLKQGASTIVESFTDMNLLQRADSLISKGKEIHILIQNIVKEVKAQQKTSNAIFKRVKNVLS
jgi:hypothetical protein